jgi:hypothetical protein
MTIAECEPGTNVPSSDVPPASVTSKLNVKSRRLAKDLNDLKIIHAFWGALDGDSLCYSMIKWWFDIICTDSDQSSADMMHDWMLTTKGLETVALEAIFFIMFSMLANVYSDNDADLLKRYIAISWPYVRDTGKALKNAFKGTRSALQTFSAITGRDAHHLIVPVGVFLGVLSALNRYAMRKYVVEPRKRMMRENAELLLKIQGTPFHILNTLPSEFADFKNSYMWVGGLLYYIEADAKCTPVSIADSSRFASDVVGINPKNQDSNKTVCLYLTYEQVNNLITANGGHEPPISGLDERQCALLRQEIKAQEPELRQRALLGAAYGGVVDGLYLYMGSMSLAVLSPALFTVMASFCVFFTLMCIATRVYEERHYQRRLDETQANIELALCGKELEALLAKLQRLSNPLDDGQDNKTEAKIANDQILTHDELTQKMQEFNEKKESLRSEVVLSATSRALSGLRNGLAAYSAIASLMFAVATIDAVFFMAFPPQLMVFGITLGMVCLLTFMTYSLLYQVPPEPEKIKAKVLAGGKSTQTIWDLCKLVKLKKIEVRDLKPTVIKEAISNGWKNVGRSPKFQFQEGFEVARSACAGGTKGYKFIDFKFNSLQKADQDGHYHASGIMICFMLVSALAHLLLWTARAFARGFGRDELDDVQAAEVPSSVRKHFTKKHVDVPTVLETVDSVLTDENTSGEKKPPLEGNIISPPIVSANPSNSSFPSGVSPMQLFSMYAAKSRSNLGSSSAINTPGEANAGLSCQSSLGFFT